MQHGEAPLTVTAVTQQLKPEKYPHVDDEGTIILSYPHAQAIIRKQASQVLRKCVGVTGSGEQSRLAVDHRLGDSADGRAGDGDSVRHRSGDRLRPS